MGLWKYIHLVLTKVINACDSLIYIYSVHVLLVFLKTSPVPANDNFPRSMVFVVDIWPSSRHSNTVGICGQLIVGVEIWMPGNTSIHFFPRLEI